MAPPLFLGLFGGATPPAAPTLTAPADSSLHWHNKIVVVSATTTDGDLDEMRWVLDPGGGESVIATDASAPYSTTWTVGTGVTPGAHTMVARAVRGGLSTDSAPISITIEQGVVQPASCKLWLAANDLAAGTLTTWADRSGNGNNGTGVASPSIDTSWPGSKKRVVLNGTSQYVTAHGIGSLMSGSDKPCTVICAYAFLTNDANYRALWAWARNNGSFPNPMHEYVKNNVANGGIIFHKQDDGAVLRPIGGASLAGTTDTGIHVASAVNSGTVGNSWSDGTARHVAIDLDVGTTTTDAFVLGAIFRGGTASLFGHVALAEVAVWNVALSTADRQTEEARLKAKWGTP